MPLNSGAYKKLTVQENVEIITTKKMTNDAFAKAPDPIMQITKHTARTAEHSPYVTPYVVGSCGMFCPKASTKPATYNPQAKMFAKKKIMPMAPPNSGPNDLEIM